LHAACACLLFSLLRRVGVGIAGALAGSCVFAVLHAPLAAVAWISAASGPLVVFFVLLSGVCWQRYLESERSSARSAWYVAALLALVCAAASKEDCVLAGPLLFGLHVVRDGWRAVLRPRGLLRYTPFALFGAVYLAFVFDPAVWADRPGVGQYSFRFEMVPKAVTNLVVLFWPRHMTIGAAPRWMLFVGIALLLVIVGAARNGRERWQRVLYLGLAVALFGLLPVLPGPWESAAASRLGYPSAIGVGMIVAAFAQGALARRSTSLRVAALCAIAAGCALHALSVRSTIAWRFVDASSDYRALVDATLSCLDASESGSVLFVAPPVWNALDHERGALAFANGRGIDSERFELPLEEIDARLGALSSRAEVVVWEDDRWVRADASTLDHEMLRRAADANAVHGHAGSVPANWLRRP
ncbi:MAG: hypothetical protein KDC14_01445, partial [Planctomycetes bacterium]|nr:hypothetical protein [Planctomycetota bacterium]